MNNQNGSMYWIAVLKRAAENVAMDDPMAVAHRVAKENGADLDSGRDGRLEWLIWGGFWFAAGAIVAWWATS